MGIPDPAMGDEPTLTSARGDASADGDAVAVGVDGAAANATHRTRFAPAPTGLMHLGHVANAIFVWGIGRALAAEVILRIEDHDRQRSRPSFAHALLDDLEWLGFVPDAPPLDALRTPAASAYRQSDNGARYEAMLERLRAAVTTYSCDCTRATFAAWAARTGRPWDGPGCPGHCEARGLAPAEGRAVRAAVGGGDEAWDDLLLGPMDGPVAVGGDPIVRDRHGNWTYLFAVVVDDLVDRVDLVVRGRDLQADTPRQIRLARLLGRPVPPTFAHHPLVRRPDGSKLSKSSGDTGVRELRAAGWAPEDVVGAGAAAVGLIPGPAPLSRVDALELAGALVAEPRRVLA